MYMRVQLEEQEMQIREEVAQEMAQAMCKIESQYKINMALELDSMQEVYPKKKKKNKKKLTNKIK